MRITVQDTSQLEVRWQLEDAPPTEHPSHAWTLLPDSALLVARPTSGVWQLDSVTLYGRKQTPGKRQGAREYVTFTSPLARDTEAPGWLIDRVLWWRQTLDRSEDTLR